VRVDDDLFVVPEQRRVQGAQEHESDSGEAVEQVVLVERARLAACHPSAGGVDPLAGDAVHVAVEQAAWSTNARPGAPWR